MTEQLITAGDLTFAEYARCEAIAWRLVHAELRGEYGRWEEDSGEGVTEDRPHRDWRAAYRDIRNHAELDAVLEVLCHHLAAKMVGTAPDFAAATDADFTAAIADASFRITDAETQIDEMETGIPGAMRWRPDSEETTPE